MPGAWPADVSAGTRHNPCIYSRALCAAGAVPTQPAVRLTRRHHLGLAVCILGQHEAGAVAQAQGGGDVQGLHRTQEGRRLSVQNARPRAGNAEAPSTVRRPPQRRRRRGARDSASPQPAAPSTAQARDACVPARRTAHLEVLGLARGGGHRRLLGAKQGVDGGGLADVGVAGETHHQPLATARLQAQGRTAGGTWAQAGRQRGAPLGAVCGARLGAARSSEGRAPQRQQPGSGGGAARRRPHVPPRSPAPRPAPRHPPPPWLPAPPAGPAGRPPPAHGRAGPCRAAAAPGPPRARPHLRHRRGLLEGRQRLAGKRCRAAAVRPPAVDSPAEQGMLRSSSKPARLQHPLARASRHSPRGRSSCPGQGIAKQAAPPAAAPMQGRHRPARGRPAPARAAPVECSSMPALADQNT